MRIRRTAIWFFYAAIIAVFLAACAGEPVSPAESSTGDETTSREELSLPVQEESSETDLSPVQSESSNDDDVVYNENVEAVLTRFTISDDNPHLSAPIEYAIDNENGSVSVRIDYETYADLYTLQHCVLDISVDGGEYAVAEKAKNADGTFDLTKLTTLLLTDSDGRKKTYTVVTERIVYDLPIVNLYLDNGKDVDRIDRDVYTSMTFSIDVTGAEEYSGTEPVSGSIRGRGHSTWLWEKKPYKIKLDKAVSVLGLAKDKEWILLANYADKSLIRNTVAYQMARSLDGIDWNPTQYPVDLFVNGVYRGVYSIGEHMKASEGRVNVEKDSPEADTGFLLEIGGSDSGDVLGEDYFHTDAGLAKYIVIKSPKDDEITDEQKRFITEYMNDAEKAIVSGQNFEEYIDVDSFCDWIIIHELAYNIDSCFRRSCYLTKDTGGKLQMGPVWDFDLAFGNCNKDNQKYNDWATVGKTADSAYVKVNWCNYLMENERFRARLHDRWFEVRDSLLEEAMNCIDRYSGKIQRSQEENFKVWQIWGKKAGYQSSRNLKHESYELQIQYLKDFLQMRASWIDQNI